MMANSSFQSAKSSSYDSRKRSKGREKTSAKKNKTSTKVQLTIDARDVYFPNQGSGSNLSAISRIARQAKQDKYSSKRRIVQTLPKQIHYKQITAV